MRYLLVEAIISMRIAVPVTCQWTIRTHVCMHLLFMPSESALLNIFYVGLTHVPLLVNFKYNLRAQFP